MNGWIKVDVAELSSEQLGNIINKTFYGQQGDDVKVREIGHIEGTPAITYEYWKDGNYSCTTDCAIINGELHDLDDVRNSLEFN